MLEKLKKLATSEKFIKCLKVALFQLLFIIVLSFLFLTDDYIFRIFNVNNKATFSLKYFSLALALSTTISILKSKKIIYFMLLIFCFIELTQLVYLSYFGTYLHPTIIPLIFEEILEIQETGFSSMGKVYYAFLAVLIPYFLMFFLVKKYHDKLYTFKFSWIIFLLLISLVPLRSMREVSIIKMLANPRYPSVYNGLRIYSGYFFNILPNSINENKNYQFIKYKVIKTNPIESEMNIVLVYGESFNYYNQSLYGYSKNTTPNLLELSKKDKNFAYKKGIAGAVSTQQSIPCFFNLQREPKNYKMQIDMQLNLFKLAKEQGYKTFYISAQGRGLTNNLGSQYVDVFITLENEEKLFAEKRDEALLEILKKQKLNEKNFIVLHQRNLHSPYEKNYFHKKKEFEKFKSSYDNAMLYNDYVLGELIKYLKNNTKIPLYLFITSDHNELTGQEGLYGHLALLPKTADIPIMLYTQNTNLKIYNRFSRIFMPTHHELGLLIAEIMGYKIINLNTPNNIYYINGNDSLARYGYIKVIKNLKEQKVDYEIIDFDKVENKQQRF